MSSQTARKPPSQRPARSNKAKRYTKQTARFEGKRDGKPLIFGWGGHLSHNQKIRIQRRVTWIGALIVLLLVIVVLAGFWININVITPGLPITSVNGHQIPQSLYRKMVAFQAELAQNSLNGPHGLTSQRDSLRRQIAAQQEIVTNTTKQIENLNVQLKTLPTGPGIQRTNLTNQLATAKKQLTTEQATMSNLNVQYTNLAQNTIPLAQQGYNQSQIGNQSVDWLQQDELIHEWLATQSSSVQARINLSSNAVDLAMKNFIAGIPSTTTYSAFLSKDGVSDDDMRAMMTIKLRRDNMQAYLASLEVSPTYQVLARAMTIDTMAHAQKVLNQLKHGADFGPLAKTNSADANTNSKGGYLDWLARGQYAQNYNAAVVENWLFDPARKLDEISPILSENGSFHIVQILSIDPTHPVDPTVLQNLKTNALSNWVLEQQALPGTKVTTADQNKLLDPLNMPPDLPLSAPGSGTNGLPGGGPSGLPPGGGVPSAP